jgi:hypothetical protein
MRIFEICHPDDTEIVTDEDIIQQYYPYWCSKMIEVGREDLISIETCIEDWMTIHWAVEIRIPV